MLLPGLPPGLPGCGGTAERFGVGELRDVAFAGLCWLHHSSFRLPGLVNLQKAIENGHRKFADFPMKHGGGKM